MATLPLSARPTPGARFPGIGSRNPLYEHQDLDTDDDIDESRGLSPEQADRSSSSLSPIASGQSIDDLGGFDSTPPSRSESPTNVGFDDSNPTSRVTSPTRIPSNGSLDFGGYDDAKDKEDFDLEGFGSDQVTPAEPNEASEVRVRQRVAGLFEDPAPFTKDSFTSCLYSLPDHDRPDEAYSKRPLPDLGVVTEPPATSKDELGPLFLPCPKELLSPEYRLKAGAVLVDYKGVPQGEPGFDLAGGANRYSPDHWEQVGFVGWVDIVMKAHASWTVAKKGKSKYCTRHGDDKKEFCPDCKWCDVETIVWLSFAIHHVHRDPRFEPVILRLLASIDTWVLGEGLATADASVMDRGAKSSWLMKTPLHFYYDIWAALKKSASSISQCIRSEIHTRFLSKDASSVFSGPISCPTPTSPQTQANHVEFLKKEFIPTFERAAVDVTCRGLDESVKATGGMQRRNSFSGSRRRSGSFSINQKELAPPEKDTYRDVLVVYMLELLGLWLQPRFEAFVDKITRKINTRISKLPLKLIPNTMAAISSKKLSDDARFPSPKAQFLFDALKTRVVAANSLVELNKAIDAISSEISTIDFVNNFICSEWAPGHSMRAESKVIFTPTSRDGKPLTFGDMIENEEEMIAVADKLSQLGGDAQLSEYAIGILKELVEEDSFNTSPIAMIANIQFELLESATYHRDIYIADKILNNDDPYSLMIACQATLRHAAFADSLT